MHFLQYAKIAKISMTRTPWFCSFWLRDNNFFTAPEVILASPVGQPPRVLHSSLSLLPAAA